jgi:putative aminopeptidase FrvX
MLDEMKGVCRDVRIDKLGNLIARKGGNRKNSSPSIMMAAHMDEVGLFIKYVRPDGYIAFELSGFVDPSILPSQWVRISTGAGGVVRGVVSTKGAHFARLDPREQQQPSSLFIDVGARSRDEVIEMGVRAGDFATYDRGLALSENGKYLIGKSLDNRIGCTVMLETFKEISEPDAGSVYAVGTVREEIGGIGARTAANSIRPDVAIVLDGLPASDPYVPMERSPVEIGRGPVIRRAEVQIPTTNVTPRWLFDLAIDAANEEGIPYQVETASSFFSDASPISAAAEGIPTIPILVGRQNSHSPAEIASIEDVNQAIRLTSALVKKLLAPRSDSR